MSNNQCLIYSTAMLLDTTPENIIKRLGHDGSEVWWPCLEIPWCNRGVHMQEILDLCDLICYEIMPRSVPIGDGLGARPVYDEKRAVERFSYILTGSPGLLVTATHACAWDGKSVYDPNGRIGTIHEYKVKEFWSLVP